MDTIYDDTISVKLGQDKYATKELIKSTAEQVASSLTEEHILILDSTLGKHKSEFGNSIKKIVKCLIDDLLSNSIDSMRSKSLKRFGLLQQGILENDGTIKIKLQISSTDDISITVEDDGEGRNAHSTNDKKLLCTLNHGRKGYGKDIAKRVTRRITQKMDDNGAVIKYTL